MKISYQPTYLTYSQPLRHKNSDTCVNTKMSDTCAFKGNISSEIVFKNGLKTLVHQTSLFREPETKKFTLEYLDKTFGGIDKKIKILSGACSSGEEAVTLSILSNHNKDNIEILGVDLSSKVINQAKSGKYTFTRPRRFSEIVDMYEDKTDYPYQDLYLAFPQEQKGLSAQQEYNKTLFNHYFKPVEENDYKGIMTKIKNYIFDSQIKEYKLKDGVADNCKFICGDINDIDNLVGDEKFNAIFFSNAMYHLTTQDVCAMIRVPKKNSESIVESLITKFKRHLVPEGIVVFGEHEDLQMADAITVPKIMKKLSFEPLNKTESHEANVWRLV